jgi:hypothetical protein
MSCDISLGRQVPCKNVVGGLNKIYFVNFGDLGAITLVDDVVTDISGSFTAYQYDLKGNSSFDQTFNSSRENGTTFFTQNLNVTLTKLTKEDNKQLKLMAYGRPYVFVLDYNNNLFLMGKNFGAEVTGGTIVTGGAMGDLSGYTLTLEGQEQVPANFVTMADPINPANAEFPFNGLTTSVVTVVKGTDTI